MHPLLQACAIVAGVFVFSLVLGLLLGRAIPPSQDDDAICGALGIGGGEMRDLRETHVGSDTVS